MLLSASPHILRFLEDQLGLMLLWESSTSAMLEDLILCVPGLLRRDKEVLCRMLQESLHICVATFVSQLINVPVHCCSREAHLALGLENGCAAEECKGSPTSAPRSAASHRWSPAPGPDPSTSPPRDQQQQHPSTSAAAFCGDPSSPLDAPVPTYREQEEWQEERGKAVAGPSTLTRGRDSFLQGHGDP